MNKRLWLFPFLAAFLVPGVSSAHKLERTKNKEAGDHTCEASHSTRDLSRL